VVGGATVATTDAAGEEAIAGTMLLAMGEPQPVTRSKPVPARFRPALPLVISWKLLEYALSAVL
jgi:hypothetical protein